MKWLGCGSLDLNQCPHPTFKTNWMEEERCMQAYPSVVKGEQIGF